MCRELSGVLVGLLLVAFAGGAAVAPPHPPVLRLTPSGLAVAKPLAVSHHATFTDMAFLPRGQDGWAVGHNCPPSPLRTCGAGFI